LAAVGQGAGTLVKSAVGDRGREGLGWLPYRRPNIAILPKRLGVSGSVIVGGWC
jgi:hypothetical protein